MVSVSFRLNSNNKDQHHPQQSSKAGRKHINHSKVRYTEKSHLAPAPPFSKNDNLYHVNDSEHTITSKQGTGIHTIEKKNKWQRFNQKLFRRKNVKNARINDNEDDDSDSSRSYSSSSSSSSSHSVEFKSQNMYTMSTQQQSFRNIFIPKEQLFNFHSPDSCSISIDTSTSAGLNSYSTSFCNEIGIDTNTNHYLQTKNNNHRLLNTQGMKQWTTKKASTMTTNSTAQTHTQIHTHLLRPTKCSTHSSNAIPPSFEMSRSSSFSSAASLLLGERFLEHDHSSAADTDADASSTIFTQQSYNYHSHHQHLQTTFTLTRTTSIGSSTKSTTSLYGEHIVMDDHSGYSDDNTHIGTTTSTSTFPISFSTYTQSGTSCIHNAIETNGTNSSIQAGEQHSSNSTTRPLNERKSLGNSRINNTSNPPLVKKIYSSSQYQIAPKGHSHHNTMNCNSGTKCFNKQPLTKTDHESEQIATTSIYQLSVPTISQPLSNKSILPNYTDLIIQTTPPPPPPNDYDDITIPSPPLLRRVRHENTFLYKLSQLKKEIYNHDINKRSSSSSKTGLPLFSTSLNSRDYRYGSEFNTQQPLPGKVTETDDDANCIRTHTSDSDNKNILSSPFNNNDNTIWAPDFNFYCGNNLSNCDDDHDDDHIQDLYSLENQSLCNLTPHDWIKKTSDKTLPASSKKTIDISITTENTTIISEDDSLVYDISIGCQSSDNDEVTTDSSEESYAYDEITLQDSMRTVSYAHGNANLVDDKICLQLSCVVIQAAFRRHLQRRNLLSKRINKATLIQRWWRRCRMIQSTNLNIQKALYSSAEVVPKYKNNYIASSAIILLQSVFRCKIRQRWYRYKVLPSVVLIQSIIRAKIYRSIYLKELRLKSSYSAKEWNARKIIIWKTISRISGLSLCQENVNRKLDVYWDESEKLPLSWKQLRYESTPSSTDWISFISDDKDQKSITKEDDDIEQKSITKQGSSWNTLRNEALYEDDFSSKHGTELEARVSLLSKIIDGRMGRIIKIFQRPPKDSKKDRRKKKRMKTFGFTSAKKIKNKTNSMKNTEDNVVIPDVMSMYTLLNDDGKDDGLSV